MPYGSGFRYSINDCIKGLELNGSELISVGMQFADTRLSERTWVNSRWLEDSKRKSRQQKKSGSSHIDSQVSSAFLGSRMQKRLAKKLMHDLNLNKMQTLLTATGCLAFVIGAVLTPKAINSDISPFSMSQIIRNLCFDKTGLLNHFAKL